jgi:hypothetical protein
VEGYDLGPVINRLGKSTAALATAAEDAAFLVQDAEPESPHITVAIQFWTLLLDTDRAKIPAQAFTGLGRWAFVNNIGDDQWAYLTARTLDPYRFRRHHPKWHDGLRGENRKWDRLARSTPRNIRTRLWSW